MSNTDRPLKFIPAGDLWVVSNHLLETAASAGFCGLMATQEILLTLRGRVLDELWARGER